MPGETINTNVLIIGGGTGGITVAAQLRKKGVVDISILDPAEFHYYQPGWTLVGGGVYAKEKTCRKEKEVIPADCKWIKAFAEIIDPEKNLVVTQCKKTVRYNYLVVAAGIQIDWDKIKGLKEGLGKNGVCSVYDYDQSEKTWGTIRNFKGGNAIFTMPGTPIKCAGGPQKIMYLAEAYFRRVGIRNRTNVKACFAPAAIFGIEAFRKPLEKILRDRNIEFHGKHNLIELNPETKTAVFEIVGSESGEIKEVPYDMIHVVPPMSAPNFIKNCPLAVKEGPSKGWFSVDKHTLQNPNYGNIFGLGDATNTPNSKTAAAIRKQAPVLVKNLIAVMSKNPVEKKYDGYASCPLITNYGKVILAEFNYEGLPTPSFPLDPTKERFSYWILKRYLLPILYWQGMLKGRA